MIVETVWDNGGLFAILQTSNPYGWRVGAAGAIVGLVTVSVAVLSARNAWMVGQRSMTLSYLGTSFRIAAAVAVFAVFSFWVLMAFGALTGEEYTALDMVLGMLCSSALMGAMYGVWATWRQIVVQGFLRALAGEPAGRRSMPDPRQIESWLLRWWLLHAMICWFSGVRYRTLLSAIKASRVS